MSHSFQFFRLNKFPQLESLENSPLADPQKQLLGSPKRLIISPKPSQSSDGVERFGVFFEIVLHTKGRLFDGHEFDTYYQDNTFDVLVDRSNKLLICLVPKKIARQFVDEANQSLSSKFNVDYLKLDFPTIRPRLNEINGIWVSGLQTQNLDVLGLFGKHVDKSQFFQVAEPLGIASSMLVEYDYAGSKVPAIISSNHGIAFPNKETEEHHLSVVNHMREHLIFDACSVEFSLFNERKKREAEKAAKEPKKRRRSPRERTLPMDANEITLPPPSNATV